MPPHQRTHRHMSPRQWLPTCDIWMSHSRATQTLARWLCMHVPEIVVSLSIFLCTLSLDINTHTTFDNFCKVLMLNKISSKCQTQDMAKHQGGCARIWQTVVSAFLAIHTHITYVAWYYHQVRNDAPNSPSLKRNTFQVQHGNTWLLHSNPEARNSFLHRHGNNNMWDPPETLDE